MNFQVKWNVLLLIIKLHYLYILIGCILSHNTFIFIPNRMYFIT